MAVFTSDIVWKDCIEEFCDEFLRFFLPELSNHIDFSKGFIFLDKELSEIRPQSAGKDRRCDKLIRVTLKNSEEQWVLVHVEVQKYNSEKDFPTAIGGVHNCN